MIYHSSINENVSVNDVLKLGIKSCLDIDVSIIIENEYKIQFKKIKNQSVIVTNLSCNKYLEKHIRNLMQRISMD